MIETNREYYKNGQLLFEIQYHQGQPHGIEKWWYSDGQLWCEASHHKGQLHGIRRAWCGNGQLQHKLYYLYGDKVTEEEYREHQLITTLSGL